MEIRKCELCSKDFFLNRKYKRFCSPKCHTCYKNRKRDGTLELFNVETWQSGPRALVCKSCKKEFVHPRITKFCSRLCRGRFHKDSIEHNKKKRISEDPKLYLSYKHNQIKLSTQNERRRRAGLSDVFQITKEKLYELWDKQDGRCALTGFDMTHQIGNGYSQLNASVDRIDNAVGYVDSNIRLVCRLANQMRFNLSDEDFLVWCKAIVNNLNKH